MQNLANTATQLITQFNTLRPEVQIALALMSLLILFALLYSLVLLFSSSKTRSDTAHKEPASPAPARAQRARAPEIEAPIPKPPAKPPVEITEMEEILSSLDEEIEDAEFYDLTDDLSDLSDEMPHIPPEPAAKEGASALQQTEAVRREAVQKPIATLGKLVENIPRAMRVNIPCLVEARISDDNKADLKSSLPGRTTEHQIQTTPAMTVVLRAPDGGFLIEPISLETQWVNNHEAEALGFLGQPNFGQWQWRVTPTERGRKKLKLHIAAHKDAHSASIALPQQEIEITVKVNYPALFKKITLWITLAVIGGLIAKFGETLLQSLLEYFS